jgi:O-acetyl-ADP-ribose deacetylase (regulator of RNase III)
MDVAFRCECCGQANREVRPIEQKCLCCFAFMRCDLHTRKNRANVKMSAAAKTSVPRRGKFWTHPSVVALASGSDPVERMVALASSTALDAMQAGWSGPPFDPFKLAEYLKIGVVPREDIPDARIVQLPDGKFQVEFNPNRPRGRVRYSIAHDLAHTLFADCGEVVRYRLGRNEQKADDWQLEMLCNIGASEFLMPVGSFPDLRDEVTDIDRILALRTTYDVSTEALLLRVVRLTEQPCAMFAASRKESGELAGRYQIDYSVFSRTWPERLASGTLLPKNSKLGDCTAIGYTSKGDEAWATLGNVHLECVGIPPYPAKSYPRIVGVISPLDGNKREAPKLTVVKGDATEPRGEGKCIIAHVVNDKAALWGAGFGMAMRKKWPMVQERFREWATKNPSDFQLGNVFMSVIDNSRAALQMICQHGYGPSQKPRLRYSALRACLEKLAQEALRIGATVHMPRIGTGQGGGSWGLVGQLVDETLLVQGLSVTVYDLPGEPMMAGLDRRQTSLFDA